MLIADFVFDGVTVVDALGSMQHRRVGLQGGRVAWIERCEADQDFRAALTVEGHGRFLAPGLTDMHSHYLAPQDEVVALAMPMHLAHGVTAVRDMNSDVLWPGHEHDCIPIETFRGWQGAIERGELLGPRLLSLSSNAVDGPRDVTGDVPTFIGAEDSEACDRLVSYLVNERGVDFIKIYSEVPRNGVFALLEAAKHQNLPVAGHKPFSVDAGALASAGQRSIEHVLEILFDCFPGADWFRTHPVYHPDTDMLRAIVDEHDLDAASSILDAMATNGVALTPTLITRRMDAMATDRSMLEDDLLRFVTRRSRDDWLADADGIARRNRGIEGARALHDLFRLGADFTARAYHAGVRVLAGSDASDSYSFHGSSLIDELEELERAGIPTAAVLAAATTEAGSYLGSDPAFGLVAEGSPADLLLLRADPSERIGHLRSLDGVMAAGRWFDRPALDEMLGEVERTVEQIDASSRDSAGLAVRSGADDVEEG